MAGVFARTALSIMYVVFRRLLNNKFDFDSPIQQPFGVSYSGASYKYTVLDTTGARSAAQGKRSSLLDPLAV